MYRAFVLLLLLVLVSPTAPVTAVPPPADVSLRWSSETTVVMSWTQQSDANWVCVNGWDDHNIGVMRQCEATAVGQHVMTFAPEHASGLQYYDIVEWVGPANARTLYGHYQSYVLYHERMLLPSLML